MQPAVLRHESLDVIRGFAVLGIFLMNIMAFGLPWPAYYNPAYYGGATGSDLWVWYVQDALFDGRMRALFAMLFGAGIVLTVERARASGRPVWRHLVSRYFWLALFGLAHLFLLQSQGDILWPYAICGLFVCLFSKLSARKLLVIAVLVLAADAAHWIDASNDERQRYASGAALMQKSDLGEPLSDDESESLQAWHEEFDSKAVSGWQQRAQQNVTNMRQQGWLNVFRYQYEEFVAAARISLEFLEYAGLMLLGMALCKWGVFQGDRSARWYLKLSLAGTLVGAPIAHVMSRLWAAESFSLLPSGGEFIWVIAAAPLSVLIGLTWASGLILLIKANLLQGLRNGLAAAGRMAFTCYLSHTLFATLLFYGYGFAQFGQYSRTQLALIAVAVWIAQITFCLLWLRYFRYGPAEWLWRSLSYRRLFPLRRREQ